MFYINRVYYSVFVPGEFNAFRQNLAKVYWVEAKLMVREKLNAF